MGGFWRPDHSEIPMTRSRLEGYQVNEEAKLLEENGSQPVRRLYGSENYPLSNTADDFTFLPSSSKNLLTVCWLVAEQVKREMYLNIFPFMLKKVTMLQKKTCLRIYA